MSAVPARAAASILALIAAAAALRAQPQPGNAVRQFVAIDAPVVALTNARVIDGTGAPAREHLAAGKQADLIVITGDPSRNIADIRNVETVFKEGVGYDPKKLIQSVCGFVGLW